MKKECRPQWISKVSTDDDEGMQSWNNGEKQNGRNARLLVRRIAESNEKIVKLMMIARSGWHATRERLGKEG